VANLAGVAGNMSGPDQQLIRRETEQRLRACLARLSAEDRELLVMRCVENLQVAEIASALAISVGAAKSRIRRALERMQELMSSDDSSMGRG
jgi:RNA polymerase sigma-70 factor (ECF subfamily)